MSQTKKIERNAENRDLVISFRVRHADVRLAKQLGKARKLSQHEVARDVFLKSIYRKQPAAA